MDSSHQKLSEGMEERILTHMLLTLLIRVVLHSHKGHLISTRTSTWTCLQSGKGNNKRWPPCYHPAESSVYFCCFCSQGFKRINGTGHDLPLSESFGTVRYMIFCGFSRNRNGTGSISLGLSTHRVSPLHKYSPKRRAPFSRRPFGK